MNPRQPWAKWLLAALFFTTFANAGITKLESPIQPRSSNDVVTWDENSIFVHGERVIFLSGEVHPFRLPSPGLWLDVFQKIKAIGFTGVSFYLDWALYEGEPGIVRAGGIFSLDEFFEAAKKAGIYLLARPGPYINAEVSGGGFPGWIQRMNATIRTSAPEFLDSSKKYTAVVGKLISKAQITNGGPVILVQPENEYTMCSTYSSALDISACLDKAYMADIQSQLREAGIEVPFISNDAFPIGNFAPGSGEGQVDIYGFDDYPFTWGSGCSDPSNWSRGTFPLSMFNYTTHMQMSPTTPFSVVEYQGGATDGWGGYGIDTCAALFNQEFWFVAIFHASNTQTDAENLQMFGGTNWGNLGHHKGYTSYDVGAAITENRQLMREKYSELKLQANFLRCTPSYATAQPKNATLGVYTNDSEINVTPLTSTTGSNFYVVRHNDYTKSSSKDYTFKASTSDGSFTIPQLGRTLSLIGRDSKIHTTDYPVGDYRLVYSSAEIFSWTKLEPKTVLILYGAIGETHEFALEKSLGCPKKVEGGEVTCKKLGLLAVIQWDVQSTRRVLIFESGLEVYLLSRNDAYNYWVLDLPLATPIGQYSSPSRANSTSSTVIVKAGYLMRTARVSNGALYLVGDVNRTTEVEIIAAPNSVKKLFFNEKAVEFRKTNNRISGKILFKPPKVKLPTLERLTWRYIDSLPEVQEGFIDEKWTKCNYLKSNNTRVINTPTSLYASDYGYHTGSLIYRGHFKATGKETGISLTTQGGYGYGHSVWLNSEFLGSWSGSGTDGSINQTFELSSSPKKGKKQVLTVLIDHMGLNDNFYADGQEMKAPRGILNYTIHGLSDQSQVSWKMSGNTGGETYLDHSRGPLNEGAMFAERRGYHLPGAPTSRWEKRTPFEGLIKPGVGFFSTTFNLDIPDGYDMPISLNFKNSTQADGSTPVNYRAQLFINGWQTGKYVNNLGPQNSFVLPEGILNHQGENYLGLTLWSQDRSGGARAKIELKADVVIQSGYQKPILVEGDLYKARGNV